MIHEAKFHQPWITGEEPDDPQIEINECVTSQIKDMPKEIQDRVEAYTGSRLGQFRPFKLKTKEKRKMKTLTMTISDTGSVNLECDGFKSDFEINGLLQTVLLHRVMNQFGLPSGVVAESLPQTIGTTESA